MQCSTDIIVNKTGLCPMCKTKLTDKSFCAFCDDEVWFVDDTTICRNKLVKRFLTKIIVE